MELPELIYNSNAIENSSLTIEETKQIMAGDKISRLVTKRELLEAENLASVLADLKPKIKQTIDEAAILYFHNILLGTIDERIAGRFRQRGEYVRVGYYVAPAPEHIKRYDAGLTQRV